MNDNVSTEPDGLLQGRGAKAVVHDQQAAVAMGQVGEALDIDEPYFFSTHPGLQDRIESFEALVQQHGATNGYRGEQDYRMRVAELQLELLQDYLELGRYQSVLLILDRPDAFVRYGSPLEETMEPPGFYEWLFPTRRS